MMRWYSSTVASVEPSTAADPRDVQHRVDLAERLQRSGEHRLDARLLRDVGVERDERVAEFLGRLLLSAAHVGAEDPRTFAHEDTGGGARHARSRTGDDRHFAVEFTHAEVLARIGAIAPLFVSGRERAY